MASGVWVACGGVADWLAFATIAEFARLGSSDSRDGCSAGDAAFEVPRVSYKGLVKRLLQINVRLHPRKKRR
jgi:hypothetical protein